MHTTTITHIPITLTPYPFREVALPPVQFHFIHNGDYSGDVKIAHETSEEWVEVSVPFKVLKEFVGRAMLSEHIATLEQLEGKEFLDSLNKGI